MGRHTICEFWGASHLDDADHAQRALVRATEAGRATLVQTFVHRFAPQGVTAVGVLAESHLSIHTWPERSYAAIDCFTCGDSVDIDTMVGSLRDDFDPDHVEVREVIRGIPPESGGLEEFVENEPAAAMRAGYTVAEVLERRRTRFQELLLFRHPTAGKVLALDGIVQVSELDTYVYHEVLAHPALVSHPHPRRVAVVGGGDALLLAEVLKHDSVERVDLCELDDEVIEVCRKHYPEAAAALADPRVEVAVADAFETVAQLEGRLDVVLVDMTDPVDQAARLFGEEFYARCERALRPDGFLVAQTESLHFHRDVVRQCFAAMERHFPRVELLWGAIATYPGAFWTMSFASKGPDPTIVRRRPELDTQLYSTDAHQWFFVPPSVRAKLLGS